MKLQSTFLFYICLALILLSERTDPRNGRNIPGQDKPPAGSLWGLPGIKHIRQMKAGIIALLFPDSGIKKKRLMKTFQLVFCYSYAVLKQLYFYILRNKVFFQDAQI